MTRRRWIADQWDETTAALIGDQAAHLARVLRAQPGMRFDVVAGERLWLAEIASVQEDAVRFLLLEELDADAALALTLLLSVFKFDRFEWAIEKVTELGIAQVVPMLVRRTEKHLAQAAAARVERWRRIAQEAAKQSRRSSVPILYDPLPLREALQLFPESQRIVLAEAEKQNTLPTALTGAGGRSLSLAIGPEGGWAPEESQLFASEGWTAVTLGPRILRAETAAIAATAIVSALLHQPARPQEKGIGLLPMPSPHPSDGPT